LGWWQILIVFILVTVKARKVVEIWLSTPSAVKTSIKAQAQKIPRSSRALQSIRLQGSQSQQQRDDDMQMNSKKGTTK
jgi:hypothetical protein